MEHTLHLAAKDFVETICPTPSRYKKGRSSSKLSTTAPPASSSSITSRRNNVQVEEADEADEADEGEEEDSEDWQKDLEKIADGVEVDEAVDFEPGDLLGKVLAFINQVCSV